MVVARLVALGRLKVLGRGVREGVLVRLSWGLGRGGERGEDCGSRGLVSLFRNCSLKGGYDRDMPPVTCPLSISSLFLGLGVLNTLGMVGGVTGLRKGHKGSVACVLLVFCSENSQTASSNVNLTERVVLNLRKALYQSTPISL